jgi:hypothetical protein
MTLKQLLDRNKAHGYLTKPDIEITYSAIKPHGDPKIALRSLSNGKPYVDGKFTARPCKNKMGPSWTMKRGYAASHFFVCAWVSDFISSSLFKQQS